MLRSERESEEPFAGLGSTRLADMRAVYETGHTLWGAAVV
jgi:hypothetical protein